MPVTDSNVALLKAQLTGNRDVYRHLTSQLHSQEDTRRYVALVNGAFVDAASRRFGPGTTSEEVIAFIDAVRSRIDDVRSRTEESAEPDPVLLGRVLLTAISDGTVTGLDPQAVRTAQLFLLAALVLDEQLSEAELDAVLARARELADGQLARLRAREKN
jgi:hypothetical protein